MWLIEARHLVEEGLMIYVLVHAYVAPGRWGWNCGEVMLLYWRLVDLRQMTWSIIPSSDLGHLVHFIYFVLERILSLNHHWWSPVARHTELRMICLIHRIKHRFILLIDVWTLLAWCAIIFIWGWFDRMHHGKNLNLRQLDSRIPTSCKSRIPLYQFQIRGLYFACMAIMESRLIKLMLRWSRNWSGSWMVLPSWLNLLMMA